LYNVNMGGGTSKPKKKKYPEQCMQIGILGLTPSDDSSSLIPSMSDGSEYARSRQQAHSDSQGTSASEVELSSQDSKETDEESGIGARNSVDLDDGSSNDSSQASSGDSKKPMQVKRKKDDEE